MKLSLGRIIRGEAVRESIFIKTEPSGACWGCSWALAMLHSASADEGFRVPEGFAVTQFADDALAHDIFSMTIDPQGRVVVSGPGYIKTLHDDNGDGVADRASLFSDFPKKRRQGLCFAGDELWATGDGALLRIRDANRDGVADGPGEELAKLRNGEHGAHAVVQGPDGWFYIVCGNDSGLSKEHIKSSTFAGRDSALAAASCEFRPTARRARWSPTAFAILTTSTSRPPGSC